jgi:hypothetical protein
MNDVADAGILLALEEPLDDLRYIAGILFDLGVDKLEKLGDVNFTEAEAGQILFMIRMLLRKSEELQRVYYREEAV